MHNDKLAILWEQYLAGRMSQAERAELSTLLQDPALQEQFGHLVNSSIGDQHPVLKTDTNKEEHILEVLQKIHQPATPAAMPRVRSLNKNWMKYAAVAIFALGAGTWFLLKQQNTKNTSHAEYSTTGTSQIRPGSDKASLTLADGTVIVLDSAANGAIARQGNTAILKMADGSINYSHNDTQAETMAMNTMRTPAGGKYHLTLPDGTRVWLNASSSITFPIGFVKSERNVTITGEVFFEVAQDKDRPFTVTGGNARVLVLGTAFNINAYEDESQLKVTLLNGGVRVSDMQLKQAVELIPGQQARLSPGNEITIDYADMSKVLAWKNDLFNFEDLGIGEAMRQISRWYNIKIVYEKGIPAIQLWGKMRRNTGFDDLLKNLTDIGVHYKFNDEKRELTILP